MKEDNDILDKYNITDPDTRHKIISLTSKLMIRYYRPEFNCAIEYRKAVIKSIITKKSYKEV